MAGLGEHDGAWGQNLLRHGFLASLWFGWALISWVSLEYFDPDVVATFVIERLPVRHETLWLAALRLHVGSALVAFPLCIALSTRWLQRRRVAHRWLGRITGVAVVALLVPSGIVLSFEAKGGTWVTLGFLLSAAIVLWAMVRGVAAARRHDLSTHARAMGHVVAQMSVAVTSRALLMGLDVVGTDPDVAYVVALWGPVLASAAAAEWFTLQRRSPSPPLFSSARSLT